jgi:acyl phosphate:glycerol-3-phosphate acyltransferase
VLTLILAAATGYVLGSIPSAFFLVKWKSNVDIRKAGSGNVGTLNSYEVTESKAVGVLVLVADLLKGVLAVFAAKNLIGEDFSMLAFSGVGAVVGHNFPVWLGFNGGRGLATGAGVMLVLGWPFVLIWCAMWYIGRSLTRDVNVGNAIATSGLLLLGLVIPAGLLTEMVRPNAPTGEFRIFIGVLMSVILVRLVNPVLEYFEKRNVSPTEP